LPLILGLLDQLSHVKVYTKIDICGAYNLVHIREGNEWKMTFKTHYGHFEYVVMPFGLINTLVVLHLMNNVFREYLDDFVVYYINDILIFSKNVEDHECHACMVLEKLQEVGVYTKLEMYESHQFEVEFLGYIIFRDGICTDHHKVQTIVDWLFQFLFKVSNVFLDLPTFINISLPIIFQYWPLLFNWLGRINLFLGSWG